MKTKFLSFLLLFSWLLSNAHELRGIVYDDNQKPVEGVGIYNRNSGNYTYSNPEGFFKLEKISLGDVILFYGLGYQNKELIVSKKQVNKKLEIVLKEAALSLDQVVLYSETDPLSKLVHIDMVNNPVDNAQGLLQKVPGLFIGQHAGGGKAEQIFLRGFDIDHGTDVSIDVDGLPVNMVSHAHGQGYADLHFIIPETIENLSFGKGPYYTDRGNFNTAGYVSLHLRDSIEASTVTLEAGRFNTRRVMAAVQVLGSKNQNAYIATEFMGSDGIFEAPQNFSRFNTMGRYIITGKKGGRLKLTASHFQSKWDASGQIPQRAVDQGLISRFGAIDATEGGRTSRTNFWLNHTKKFDEHNSMVSSAYVSAYDFDLFSNFTFFLVDPENGDQIRQREKRITTGAQTAYTYNFHAAEGEKHHDINIGSGFRLDKVSDVELSRTANRQDILERLAFGDVDELNAFSFARLNLTYNKWQFAPGMRLDYFNFKYLDRLDTSLISREEDKFFFSPSFNVTFNPDDQTRYFLKTGYGFHSNDSRVVIANNGVSVLPGAFGADIGLIHRTKKGLFLNAAVWGLWMQQEFVYVGDAGIVEPSGRTRRLGVDFGLKYLFKDLVYFSGDINYAFAVSRDDPKGDNYIPLAPPLTLTAAATIPRAGAFSGGLDLRYLSDRPANEDKSLVARGYMITDLNLNYHYKNWTLGLVVENLFDTAWEETQFATESRLAGETTGIEEIHFTPGTPFFIKSKLSLKF